MDMVMTLVWYPWTEGQGGPAGTQGAFRTLDLELRDTDWPRLPSVGETIFFDDGGAAAIEAVGWKLDGTAYVYLGKRYERKGELLPAWLGRGFHERAPDPSSTVEPASGAPAAPAAADAAVTPGAAPVPAAAEEPETLPPMPGAGQPAAQ